MAFDDLAKRHASGPRIGPKHIAMVVLLAAIGTFAYLELRHRSAESKVADRTAADREIHAFFVATVRPAFAALSNGRAGSATARATTAAGSATTGAASAGSATAAATANSGAAPAAGSASAAGSTSADAAAAVGSASADAAAAVDSVSADAAAAVGSASAAGGGSAMAASPSAIESSSVASALGEPATLARPILPIVPPHTRGLDAVETKLDVVVFNRLAPAERTDRPTEARSIAIVERTNDGFYAGDAFTEVVSSSAVVTIFDVKSGQITGKLLVKLRAQPPTRATKQMVVDYLDQLGGTVAGYLHVIPPAP